MWVLIGHGCDAQIVVARHQKQMKTSAAGADFLHRVVMKLKARDATTLYSDDQMMESLGVTSTIDKKLKRTTENLDG
jgi:hypothetical protein